MVEKTHLPVSVKCLNCGGEFDFLPSHLKAHNLTSGEYRDIYGLTTKAPLHSDSYATRMRLLIKPEEIQLARDHSSEWNAGYRDTVSALAEQGHFLPSVASRLTGIPPTTLYTAMELGILPFAEASLLVYLAGKSGVRIIGSRQPVKLIEREDLDVYTKRHRSLSGKLG